MTTFQRMAKMPTASAARRDARRSPCAPLGSCTSWSRPAGQIGSSVPSTIWTTIWGVEPRLDHEVEALERLVGLVDAVDEVEHLEREVDDEGVEEVARDGVEAGMSIGGPAPALVAM
jgi:hypothetical protein